MLKVLNGVTSGPSPAPGLLPPSHPTPSEVGDGRSGEMGRVTLLPLVGSGGGVRAAELPLGGTSDAQPGEGVGGLSHNPGILPPSHPNPSKVGEGIYFNGDGGGGGHRSSSFFESTTTKGSTVCPVEKRHLASSLPTPPLTFPTNTLKLALVCFFFLYVLVHLLI